MVTNVYKTVNFSADELEATRIALDERVMVLQNFIYNGMSDGERGYVEPRLAAASAALAKVTA